MQPEEPGAGLAPELADLEMATRRLLATAALLTDAQVREPSRLPGWTRGHVLTHLARNADGCCNLLAWARTGTETPMYPSEAARDAAIAAGAGRRAADIAADARDSARRAGHCRGPAARRGLGGHGGPARAGVPGAGAAGHAPVRSGDPPRRPGRRVPAR